MGNKTSTNKIYKLYMKDYLIVYGHNISRGCSCYKETEIQRNELVKYMPIIKKIHDTKDGLENWTGGIILERLEDGSYIEHNSLSEMYPEFDKQMLNEFAKYLPYDITCIESIKIFSGDKIKII